MKTSFFRQNTRQDDSGRSYGSHFLEEGVVKAYLGLLIFGIASCGQTRPESSPTSEQRSSSVEITQIDDEAKTSDATLEKPKTDGSIELDSNFLLTATDEAAQQDDVDDDVTAHPMTLSQVVDPESDPEEQIPLMIRSYLNDNEEFDGFIGSRREKTFKDALDEDDAYACLEKTLQCSLDGDCGEDEVTDICIHSPGMATVQMAFHFTEEKSPDLCFLVDGLIVGDDILFMHLESLRFSAECFDDVNPKSSDHVKNDTDTKSDPEDEDEDEDEDEPLGIEISPADEG